MESVNYGDLSTNEFAIHKINQFLIETGIKPYRLGLEACGSSNFYDRLIRGKARLATIAQVEAYIAEQRKLWNIPLPIDPPAAGEAEIAENEVSDQLVRLLDYKLVLTKEAISRYASEAVDKFAIEFGIEVNEARNRLMGHSEQITAD